MEKRKKIIITLCVLVITIASVYIGCSLSSTALQDTVTATTKKRIQEIRNTKNTDISKRTGRVYYVSNAGDDTNDGLSPEHPIKTLNKVQTFMNNSNKMAPGDTILFRRGDEFRGQLTVNKNDILLGSYGDESKGKPILNSSTYDGTKTGEWVNVTGNIWKYQVDGNDQVFKKDIGEIWFFCKSGNNNCDRTTTMGDRKYKISQKKLTNDDVTESEAYVRSYITKDLEFIHFGHANGNTASGGALYLYSVGNPTSRFDEIEFNVGGNGIYA